MGEKLDELKSRSDFKEKQVSFKNSSEDGRLIESSRTKLESEELEKDDDKGLKIKKKLKREDL